MEGHAQLVQLQDIQDAAQTIRGIADGTPMVPSSFMSTFCGQEFLLKLELTQPIGAFKLRGAVNAVAALPENITGVTCASTGNHGRAVAYAAAKRGLQAVICMSQLVPQTKIDGITALGAEARIIGESQDAAMIESQRLASEEGFIDISPFDDADVIAGQGTIGLEMLIARPDLETLLIPLSGGGLAAGIAVAAKALKPDIRIVGISMERGAAMQASLHAGHPVEVTELASLADSLGGGIGLDNRISFVLCQTLLDDTVLVSEAEIAHAMQTLYFEDRLVAEGGSVVGLAAVLSGKLPEIVGPIATILTGRNVDMSLFHRIVSGKDVRIGNLTVNGCNYGA